MAEIDQEVRRRRAAGDFPPALERELDLAFARFAPATRQGDDMSEAVGAVERSAAIDVAVPGGGRRPGEATAKRALRKAMAWYLNYLAQQMSDLGSSTARSLRLLGDRLAALEERAARSAPPDPGPGPERADLSAWHGLVLEELSGATGRVLHAECGDGELVAVLRRSGLDAYGVDPGAESESAALRGEELWPDSALDHLGAVSDGALGGLVLSGCVDRLPVRGQRRLVGLAGSKLAAGSSLVVLASSPQAWARRAPSAQVDLAGGRPLHAETWGRLLAEAGLGPARVSAGPRVEGLGLAAGPGPGGGAIRAAMARLDELLFGPSTFAVVASRAS